MLKRLLRRKLLIVKSVQFTDCRQSNKERMSLYKVTFSILKIVESKNGNLSVYPINALYDKCDITSERDMLISDCTKIYNTFTGKKEMAIDILDEYVCFEKIKDAL